MRQYVPPCGSVLDLFSYTAAWALHALAAGAGEATAVDTSRGALDLAKENARLNGFEGRFHAVRDGAVDFLKKADRTWDVIILDPPAFIRSRAQIKEGFKGYIDVNRRALGKLNPGGTLVTCSCSQHLDAAAFEEMLTIASRQAGRQLRVLDVRGQGPDHPMLLSMPETRYLKLILAQVL
jgi:23S rRNA (cytosine1962-C5)-methyltransferase